MPLTDEQKAEWGRRMAQKRAEKKALGAIQGASDSAPVTEAEPEPEVEAKPKGKAAPAPTYSSALAIDSIVLASADPEQFDPDAVYVVLEGCIGMPYGPEGEWQEPLFHGDLVAAQPQDGVRALACEQLMSPAENNRVCQKESDGRDKLKELWDRGKIAHPTAPIAIEARRNRITYDALAKQVGSDRLADPRLNIIANGGRVSNFAYGEKVQ